MSADPLNVASEWAWLLFDGLAAAGVRDVVISPGSRSTPFVLACHGNPRLICHDVIDERSAAFFALGLAKTTGRPSVLLCTSGTAGAHYFPAIIEARQTATPLIVVTADRPVELQQCGAPQTIDQIKLFGDQVRLFVDLGNPDPSPSAVRWLHRTAARAVAEASGMTPGPVHLNARARKPLEPPLSEGEAERALHRSVRALGEESPFQAFAPRAVPSPEGLDALAHASLVAKRGLIVCGPGPLTQADARSDVAAFARMSGFPLLCEAASQFRFCEMAVARCDAFDALCRSPRFRSEQAPDLIVQLGGAPTSAGWEAFVSSAAAARRVVISPHAFSDPHNGASAWLMGDLREVLRGATERLTAARRATEPTAWSQGWSSANDRAWRAVDEACAGQSLTEGKAVRTVVERVPRGTVLMLGNSLPIREVDTFCRSSAADCLVLSQRGASGIDGLISGAAGAAAAGKATTLLLGDVSFLHDLGGLAVARGSQVPLTIVVINNQGGRIFDQLPVASSPAATSAMKHWTTPPGLVLEHAAAAFGIGFRHVDTMHGLVTALVHGQTTPACTVVEVAVPPHSSADAYRAIDAAVEAGS